MLGCVQNKSWILRKHIHVCQRHNLTQIGHNVVLGPPFTYNDSNFGQDKNVMKGDYN